MATSGGLTTCGITTSIGRIPSHSPLRLDKSQGMQKSVPKPRPEAALRMAASPSLGQAQDRQIMKSLNSTPGSHASCSSSSSSNPTGGEAQESTGRTTTTTTITQHAGHQVQGPYSSGHPRLDMRAAPRYNSVPETQSRGAPRIRLRVPLAGERPRRRFARPCKPGASRRMRAVLAGTGGVAGHRTLILSDAQVHRYTEKGTIPVSLGPSLPKGGQGLAGG